MNMNMNVNMGAKPVITFNKVSVPMQQQNSRNNTNFNEDGNDLDVNTNEINRKFPIQNTDTVNPLLIKKSSTHSTNSQQNNKTINYNSTAPNK